MNKLILKKYNNFVKRFILIAVLIGIALPKENNLIAVTTKAKGDVTFRAWDSKDFSDLKPAKVLNDGDHIRTGSDGFGALVYLDDKSTIKIKENTNFDVKGTRGEDGISKRLMITAGTVKVKIQKEKIQKVIKNRPVWLAASTHANEERFAVQIHLKLKKSKKLKNLLTIIVPRNIKRVKKIKNEIKKYTSSVDFFSSKKNIKKKEIIIDNSIGQLELWYKKIKTVFLGKSFPPIGGQNPIEPAKYGCSIVSGEMSNFKEIQNEMVNHKSLFVAKNFMEFYSFITKMQLNAKKYVESKSKILDSTISKIKKYLV